MEILGHIHGKLERNSIHPAPLFHNLLIPFSSRGPVNMGFTDLDHSSSSIHHLINENGMMKFLGDYYEFYHEIC
jgi:hypothetical protein